MIAAFARRAPAAIALALGTVYLVWGSTYLAIRVAVDTLPPLLMSSVRFLVAGGILYAWSIRRGDRVGDRPGLRQWVACAIVGGALLLVGNGGIAWAEQRVDSGLAALIVALTPLWIAVLDRLFFGKRLSPVAILGLAVGFGAAALLVRPGGGTDVLGGLVVVGCTLSWAAGSLYAREAPLPSRPLSPPGCRC